MHAFVPLNARAVAHFVGNSRMTCIKLISDVSNFWLYRPLHIAPHEVPRYNIMFHNAP